MGKHKGEELAAGIESTTFRLLWSANPAEI
jgi:hypothetical protein